VYAVNVGGTATTVDGLVEDDFRFEARESLNGSPALEEVVDDDSDTVHVLDPAALKPMLRAPRAGQLAATTPGGTTLDALLAHQWVVDSTGAPYIYPPAGQTRAFGQDPILDSLSVLDDAAADIGESSLVSRFNPESETYKASEDPFPRPASGSGVLRYDYTAPPIPKASEVGVVPTPAEFRKMSVYVKDGIVIQVREDIDVRDRLSDLERTYGVKFTGLSPQRATAVAVAALNALRQGQGLPPIMEYQRVLSLQNVGSDLHVTAPPGAVPGNLGILVDRGAATIAS
jgi:hypothetical protein